jgi:hypothetical protein
MLLSPSSTEATALCTPGCSPMHQAAIHHPGGFVIATIPTCCRARREAPSLHTRSEARLSARPGTWSVWVGGVGAGVEARRRRRLRMGSPGSGL